MENPNYNIDEIFRQRLHDAEVPPPPFVWPAVEQALHKSRRRRAMWLFAFGIAIACIWVGTLLIPWNSSAPQSAAVPMAKGPFNEQKTTVMKQENIAVEVPTKPSIENPKNKSAGKSSAKEPASVIRTNSPLDPTNEPSAFAPSWLELRPALTDISSFDNTISPIAIQNLPIPDALLVTSNAQQKKVDTPKAFKLLSRWKKDQPNFCYDFARHPSAWLLDIYGGPSLAQSAMTSRLDDEPYLHERQATERRNLAMNAGARLSLMFNRNLLIRTGLHYDQVTEVFEFIDPASVTYILRYNTGDPIPDTLGVQYGENYLKTYNRYGMLDLPLMVGVEMRRGRSGFSINAGVSANVLFKKRGVIIDPNTHEPARFGPAPEKPKNIGPNATLSEEVFRPNVGLSANASIQCYWHPSTHLRLFVEPSFRQVLRPVSKNAHPVEHRLSILGLRLGATKIF